MAEEKKVEMKEQKKDLKPVEEFIKTLDFPEWQKIAFLQFSGWKSGKLVDTKQFETSKANFLRKYGGTK